ncbi:hypothetical protein Tco_0722303 [Tanacetum coccineum]
MSFSKRSENAQVCISRYYTLDEGCYPTYWDDEDEEMDLFAFIQHADPTKVRIREREVREGEVPLLELTRGHVIPLARVNDQGGADVQGAGDDDVNQGNDDDAAANHAEQSGPVVQIKGIDIEVDAETQALVADKPKKVMKRKTTDGDSGSGLPSKRLSANATDEEVSSLSMSIVSDPAVLTTAIATTVVACTSASLPRGGHEPARASIFADSTSTGMVGPNVEGPSQPADTDPTTDNLYVSLDMGFETLHQTYVPKWDVLNESALDESNVCHSLVDQLAPPVFFSQLRAMKYDQLLTEFNVGVARQTCLGAEVRMRLEHVLRGKKRLEGKCGMQTNLLKEKDAESVDLKARLSLREAKATEAIRLRGQIENVEAAEAARAGELENLKERNVALEGRVTTLKSAAIAKDSEVAKLTQELSNLQLSCDDLSIKASTLECEKDKLVDHVSKLEATCFGLRDEVARYKLFKEQVEAVQDEQVKALSDHVGSIDSDLMDMALHIDEDFYPRYLTTIARRRWILGRGLKLVVIKCLQSPEYLYALGGALGGAIDKGMQDGLAAGVDHGRATKAEEDQVIIRETSLSFSLELAHVRAQRIRGDTTARRSSLTDAIVPLLEPLSAKSLTGETSTSGFPAMTTALSTTFVQASTVPPAPSAEVPPSPKIAFEQEELNTMPEHASAP